MNKTMKPDESLGITPEERAELKSRIAAQVKNDTLSHLKINQDQTVANRHPDADLMLGAPEHALASYLEVDLTAAVETQMQRVKADSRQGLETALRMGLRLLAVREQCKHGEFEGLMQEAGVGLRDGRGCMQLARAYAAEGDQRRRDALLEMGKSKALILLTAMPDVREKIMESPELMRDAMEGSKRDFEKQMAELKAQITDLSVERDTAQGERDSLAQQLQRRRTDNGDSVVPMVVADLRAEIAALVKKAELAITALYPVGVEVMGLRGTIQANEWAEPTLRLGLSGLLAVRELVDGTIKSYSEAMGERIKRLQSGPDVLAFLDESEIKSVAEEWEKLTAVHQHEAALRAYERENARPKGKGRPKSAPVAPGAKS